MGTEENKRWKPGAGTWNWQVEIHRHICLEVTKEVMTKPVEQCRRYTLEKGEEIGFKSGRYWATWILRQNWEWKAGCLEDEEVREPNCIDLKFPSSNANERANTLSASPVNGRECSSMDKICVKKVNIGFIMERWCQEVISKPCIWRECYGNEVPARISING